MTANPLLLNKQDGFSRGNVKNDYFKQKFSELVRTIGEPRLLEKFVLTPFSWSLPFWIKGLTRDKVIGYLL